MYIIHMEMAFRQIYLLKSLIDFICVSYIVIHGYKLCSSPALNVHSNHIISAMSFRSLFIPPMICLEILHVALMRFPQSSDSLLQLKSSHSAV